MNQRSSSLDDRAGHPGCTQSLTFFIRTQGVLHVSLSHGPSNLSSVHTIWCSSTISVRQVRIALERYFSCHVCRPSCAYEVVLLIDHQFSSKKVLWLHLLAYRTRYRAGPSSIAIQVPKPFRLRSPYIRLTDLHQHEIEQSISSSLQLKASVTTQQSEFTC